MKKEEFLKKCISNNIDVTKYNYDRLPDNFVMRDKIEIKCLKHNIYFKQYAQNHKLGNCGCDLCKSENTIKSHTKSKEEFISDAIKCWGPNKYDYTNTIYTKADSEVLIHCNIHNHDFKQNANQHIRGHEGCDLCKSENRKQFQTKSIEEFISDANIVWNEINKKQGTKYSFDYSKVKYLHSQEQIIIKCNIHNVWFKQNPHGHLQGHTGCYFCNNFTGTSRMEKEILEFIKSQINMEIIQNDRTILSDNKELDIYIPEKKIAIEFDGLYWHSELQKPKDYHLKKTQECEEKGIQLIHIFENEWRDKRTIVESKLKQILGLTKFKIPARKCKIKTLSSDIEKIFMNNNHLQGYVSSNICYGLYFEINGKEYLCAAMSFGNLRKNLGQNNESNTFELYRFCNAKNYTVIGGASKLFKHFIKTFKPSKIISYANRRYSIDSEHNLYRQLNFQLEGVTPINYFYIVNNNLINRFSLRKDILVSKYGCPKEKTEHQFCTEQGWYRIYDCGNLKYVWTK